MKELNSVKTLTDSELNQINGGGKHALGLLSGMVSGAGIGSAAGPWGALGGVVVGGIIGLGASYD